MSLAWATPRQTAAISVVFNLMNSTAALAGRLATMPLLPARLPVCRVGVGSEDLSAHGWARCTSTHDLAAAGFPLSYSGRTNECCLFLGDIPSLLRVREAAALLADRLRGEVWTHQSVSELTMSATLVLSDHDPAHAQLF
jgi:hypothetical protein